MRGNTRKKKPTPQKQENQNTIHSVYNSLPILSFSGLNRMPEKILQQLSADVLLKAHGRNGFSMKAEELTEQRRHSRWKPNH